MHYRMISADNHFNEPPNLFEGRLPQALRERAPRLVDAAGGGQGWMWDGAPPKESSISYHSMVWFKGREHKPEEFVRVPCRHEDLAPGSWDPKAAVREMQKDGTDASVWYPSLMTAIHGTKDTALRNALLRAYNDWQAEFCAHDPDRLVAITQLPVDEETLDPAIAEMRRGASIGLRGALIPLAPKQRLWDRWWDPLWAAAQEAGVAIHFHKGVGLSHRGTGDFGNREGPGMYMLGQVQSDYTYSMPIGDCVFGGVFDRFPKLKIVSGEGRIGWLIHFCERGDISYKRHHFRLKHELKRLPSEYVRENVYSTFLEDRSGILMRQLIGTDNQMWSSDYPHSDSTWPNSTALNERQFAGVPEEDKRKMLALNAARLYGLPADEFKAKKAA